MRALLLILAIAATAHAAPDEVSEADLNALLLAQARVETAQAQLELAQARFQARYALDGSEQIDQKTRRITRKPKAAEKAAKP